MNIPTLFSEKAHQASALNKGLKDLKDKKLDLPDVVLYLRIEYKKAYLKSRGRGGY